MSEKSLFAEYTYKCDKHIDCQYEMRITFSGKHITKPWIPSESGEHSEDQTSIQLKRGINPIFLPFIDSEIERNTAPKTILKLIREKTWADDVTLPSALQINNRKQFSSAKVQGPLTQYNYAVNLITWVKDNMLKNKEHYDSLPEDQYFTMGYVEYTKNTKNGPEPAIGFAYTTKGINYYT